MSQTDIVTGFAIFIDEYDVVIMKRDSNDAVAEHTVMMAAEEEEQVVDKGNPDHCRNEKGKGAGIKMTLKG